MVRRLKHILNRCLTASQAKQIHAHVIVNNLYNLQSLLVRQILVSARNYSTSIAHYVRNILYHLHNPDPFSWGFTIRYFSQRGHFNEALLLYIQMLKQGLCPSSFAMSSSLRACARILYKRGGTFIHAQSYKYGYCGCVYVKTALVDLYSKLGDMNNAIKVFDEMVDKTVVSWNSILNGYLKLGNLDDARFVFDQMPEKDVVSWNSILSGYASKGYMDKACLLFQQMSERNCSSWNAMISGYVDYGNIDLARKVFDEMPQRNNVSGTIMISGYSKYGNVESAWELFNQMTQKDLVLFNAMISCFAQNNQPKQAIKLFNEMVKDDADVQPDEMTLASVLSASSQLGDERFGLWIEAYIKKAEIELDDHLITALINLYAKCGNIDKAYELFHVLKKKDVVAYSALILGFGINGKIKEAIRLFEEMVDARTRPNLVTFNGLLTAYNHAGLVEEGYQCFNSMKDHQLVPSVDHYAIMVDLLGRAGRLEEAFELIKGMRMPRSVEVWGALLLACEVHSNIEYGEIAAQHCFNLEPNTTAYYSLLANIYASVGRWDDARKMRKVMKVNKLVKTPGCSWTEST